jgi:hypothetical protein
MRFTFRLLTLLCYFLPCTFFLSTCNNGFDLRFSYNQKEADSNLIVAQESIDTTIKSNHISKTTRTQVDTLNKGLNDTVQLVANANSKVDFRKKLIEKVILPTDKSLSGIGAIFYYKNLVGKIAIAISLFASLVLFFAFKYIKPKRGLYLLLTAFLCLLLFIIDSFISGVTLLFGTWLLFLLYLLQMIIAINDSSKANR